MDFVNDRGALSIAEGQHICGRLPLKRHPSDSQDGEDWAPVYNKIDF